MTDDRGRSRSVSDLAGDKAIVLIGMFLEDEAFAKEARLVRARLQDLVMAGLDQRDLDLAQLNHELAEILDIQVEKIAVQGAKKSADTRITGKYFDARELEDLAQDAQSIGERFGLNAPWVGYAILLPQLVFSYFSAVWDDQNPSAAEVWAKSGVLVHARYSPLFDKRKDVERDIDSQAKDQLDAIDRQWSRGAGIRRHRTKPAAEQHLKWLFFRLKDPKTYTWARIAADSQTEDRTVRDAVENLARDLQVELPQRPPGRPKK